MDIQDATASSAGQRKFGAAAPEKMHLNVSKNLKRNFFISVGLNVCHKGDQMGPCLHSDEYYTTLQICFIIFCIVSFLNIYLLNKLICQATTMK